MVAESACEYSFKIGLLVFEILHNQYFRIQYGTYTYVSGIHILAELALNQVR